MKQVRGGLSVQLRRAPTKYEPLELIAAGGMAEVWRAKATFETGLTHFVAIKRALPELSADPQYRQMFQDEARLGMLLRHKNIVRVYDSRLIGGVLIMIMEWVDGISLRDILARAHQRGAQMPLGGAAFMVREIAKGLDYAHKAMDTRGRPLGLIHRDVSPQNILLGKDGAVKLADFGLADASTHEHHKAEGMVGGKVGYLAPEILEQKPATVGIDVFAAGVVLWEALAGRRLFDGTDQLEVLRKVMACEVPPISQLNSRVPKAVDDVLARALHRDPEKRLPTAAALAMELDVLLSSLEPGVGARDIALLVGLQIATQSLRPAMTADLSHKLAQQLDEFARAAAGDAYVVGHPTR